MARINELQWRAYIGPRFFKTSNEFYYDWLSIVLDSVGNPTHAATYLTVTVSPSDTYISIGDSSTWPDSGSGWVGPNGLSQNWGRFYYSSKDDATNRLLGVTFETEDDEYYGYHSAGAPVRFWWPLDNTVSGSFEANHYSANMESLGDWEISLSGYKTPAAILKDQNMVLIVGRWYDDATGWEDWNVFYKGWITGVSFNDSSSRVREWRAKVSSILGIAKGIQSNGLRIGGDDLASSANATTSSDLLQPLKEDGSGEFTESNPDLTGDSTLDGNEGTLWISDILVGEDNPGNIQSDGDPPPGGFREKRGISQVHPYPYVGQSSGYRWIEIYAAAETTITEDWLIYDYDYFLYIIDNITIEAGNRIILCENPQLFASKNEYEEASLIDMNDYTIGNLNNRTYHVDLTSATGGTYTISDGSSTTVPIGIADSKATIQAAINGLDSLDSGNSVARWVATGIVEIKLINSLGSENGLGVDLTADFSGITGSATFTKVNNGGTPIITSETGNNFFNYFLTDGGILRLFWPVIAQGQSQVVWGDRVGFPGWAPGWVGNPLPNIEPGQTARMFFAGTIPSPTNGEDYWIVSDISTPGYSIENGDFEWIQLDVKEMGLTLAQDLDIATGVGGLIYVKDAAGNPSVEGLYDSGIIQIFSEQIAYDTRNFDDGTITITQRGYGGTTVADHVEGDLVLAIDDGVATDAFPISGLEIRRKAGLSVIENYRIWGSKLALARTPDDDSSYTVDYELVDSNVANVSSTITVDLSSAPKRYSFILIEIFTMSEKPSRAKINDISITADAATSNPALSIDPGYPQDLVDNIISSIGIDPTIVTVNTTAFTLREVEGFEIEPANLFRILSDFCRLMRLRLLVNRDSTIEVEVHPYWWSEVAPVSIFSITIDDSDEFSADWEDLEKIRTLELESLSENNGSQGTLSYSGGFADVGIDKDGEAVMFFDDTQATNYMQRLYHYFSNSPAITLRSYYTLWNTNNCEICSVDWQTMADFGFINSLAITSELVYSISNGGVDTVVTLRKLGDSDDK